MDKKGTKILVGCILCTMIVLMLFIIVIKFTQLSCELVALEPVALRNSQLDSFQRDKPIRSHDKTILMKISAFLEYNVQETSSSDGSKSNSGGGGGGGGGIGGTPTAAQTEPPRLTINNANLNGSTQANGNSGQAAPAAPPLAGATQNQHQSLQAGGFGNKSLPSGGPQPSVPQNNFNPLQNTSFISTKPLTGQQQQQHNQHNQAVANYGQRQHPRAEKRFLPLELKSIETRNLGDHKHKYILSFNCTKLNMILVHQNNTVYVEKMDMELKPVGIRQKATCELSLEGGRAFMVPAPAATAPGPQPAAGHQQQPHQSNNQGAANLTGRPQTSTATATTTHAEHSSKDDGRNMARYFCDKPLRFECHYWNKKSGPTATNGFLLADLQINAIEFETSRSHPSGKGDHKHVKSEFKSKRSVCM